MNYGMYLSGCNIDDLKNVIIIPILKPGKDPNCSESYRPISLMSCILKTLERMIKSRLEWWLSNQNLLPLNQFGYKKGFGTIDAVLTLTTDIQISYSRNNYLSTLFLDLKGAYESVNLNILEEKLCKFFFVPNLIARNIINLYSNRLIYVRNSKNERIGPRLNSCGIPQGSVLSPLLFNLYTADIHRLNIPNLKIIQYADDICIYTEHKKWDKSLETLEYGVLYLRQWIFNNGFELSQEKSICSVFTRHNLPQTTNIQLAGYNFPFQSKIKYLGVILDKKLTWKPFIESIKNKCIRGINFLKFVTKIWWGADVETALTFYKAYIRSIIDYGCILYGSASKSLLNNLDVTQRKALRICLGAMKSTPNDALHVEALEPPLSIRRQFLSEKFILKLTFCNIPLLNKISTLNTLDLTNTYWTKKPSPPMCISFRDCNEQLNNIENISTNEFDYWALFAEHRIFFPSYTENTTYSEKILLNILDQFKNPTIIYTDASKLKDGNGCSYFIPFEHVEVKFKLDINCSIFTSEAIAIYKALSDIRTTESKEIIILSDSLSVLTAVNNTHSFSYKINPYIFKIKNTAHNLIKSGKTVIFVWVKAHIGLKHNERVDRLAKEAAINGTLLDHKICLTDYHNQNKLKARNKWMYNWEQHVLSNTSRYGRLQPSIPRQFWHKNLKIPRKYVATIIRLRFGHASYPAHLYKINILPSQQCELCGITSDLDHIFFECRLYKNASNKLIKNIISGCNILPPFNLLNLLSIGSKKLYECIIGFLVETNLKL